MTAQASAASEWRQYWHLPIAAALGYSTAVLASYGIGPFVEPLEREFGWSRASISFGLTIVGLSGAVLSIPVGMLIDRFGPRRLALVGGLLMPVAFALLSTATGSLANWFFLWSIMAFAVFWIQGTVWVAAVGSRFEASRGLAMAVTMSGASLTSALLPFVATAIIAAAGWRTAFVAVGAIWLVLAYPFIFLFFRGAHDAGPTRRDDDRPAAAPLAGLAVGEAVRMRQFYQLIAASLFYAFAGIGTIVHFVPILTDRGATALGAAGVASLVGLFSLVGRLTTGLLLDRFRANYVGAAVFMLPVISCALLIADGASPASQTIAAAFFGFTLGAELDVIAYLTARHFGLRNYGVLLGTMTGALAIGTALGPLAAGAAFDIYGSYLEFLMLTAALMGISGVAVAALGRGRAEA